MDEHRIFFVDYNFLTCGDIFTLGMVDAARELNIPCEHAEWYDERLLSKITAYDPSLIFVVHGRKFYDRWQLKFPPWLMDRTAVWLLDEPYETDDTQRWSGWFNTVFVNDPSTVNLHRNAHYLPVAYSPSIHHPPEGGNRIHQVGFIGGWNPTREKCLLRLLQEGLLSYVIGPDWKKTPLRSVLAGENITPQEVAKWYQNTKIILNVFRDKHHWNKNNIKPYSLNPRIYEALACRALVISEWRPEMSLTFPGVPTFTNVDEMMAQVKGMLSNDEARTRTLHLVSHEIAHHTYTNRLRRVLEAISNAHQIQATA